MTRRVTSGTSDIMALTPDQATRIPRPQSGSMSVYKPAYAVEVVDFMGKGFSLTAFAGEIGQSFEVICDWMRDCPEFAVAVAKGRAKRVRGLEETFLTTENGPKVASHKHALNNAAPHEWRDRVEHTGADGGPLEISWQMPSLAPPAVPGDTARDVTPAVLDATPEPALGDGEAVAVEWADGGAGDSETAGVSNQGKEPKP